MTCSNFICPKSPLSESNWYLRILGYANVKYVIMTKRIFIAGCDIGSKTPKGENIIPTQSITEEVVKVISYGMELEYEDDALVRAYTYQEDNIRVPVVLDEYHIGRLYKECEPHTLLSYVEDPKGFHQLGGELPEGFKMPEHNCVVPFQYLGFISNEDPTFSWLPFPLHLIFPLYLNCGPLYLDYSNPSSPVLLNREGPEKSDTSFEMEMNKDSELVYEEKRFGFIKEYIKYSNGYTGVPIWVQGADIPVSPVTGKALRFVGQVSDRVKTKRSNVVPRNEHYKTYFDKMEFWGSGVLYVFYEPETNIASLLIQGT